MCVCVCVYIDIYIYIYRERERERDEHNVCSVTRSLTNHLRAVTVATVLRWFASDTAHIVFIQYNICGEVSAHLYGEEQSF